MLAHRFQTGRCVVLLHPLGSSSGTDYAIPPYQLARDEHQRGTNPNTGPNQLGGRVAEPSTAPRALGIRVLNTCLYQGFLAALADREEAGIR
jgi:hypothetical protein